MVRPKASVTAVLLCLPAVVATAAEAGLRLAEDGMLRTRARQAFAQGDYEAMAKAYAPLVERLVADADAAAGDVGRLASLVEGRLDDCVGLGHAHQLAGEWAKAVAAYQRAVGVTEVLLKAAAAAAPPRAVVERERVARSRSRALLLRAQRAARWKRAALILLIGRIQRDELGDPAAAMATFARGPARPPVGARSPDKPPAGDMATMYALEARRELALTRGKTGTTREAARPPMIRLRSEVLPRGGELTCGGRPMRPNAAFTDLEAGRYVFAYGVPGRRGEARIEAALAAGGKYGLFLNLDSPFRWSLTTLRGFQLHPWSHCSLARLPDGRWLAAYVGEGSTIRLSRSADLVRWEKPWPLSCGSVGRSIEPCLHVDEQGAVWLAYLSNRLQLDALNQGGDTLWLASSRDGRTWSRPRPIAAGPVLGTWSGPARGGGWFGGGAQILRGPGGRCWVFWGRFAGSASHLSDLRELRPFADARPGKEPVRNPHVAVDGAGAMHMVFIDPRWAVRYSTSRDGRSWSEPVVLLSPAKGRPVFHAQLILDRERAALLREDLAGGWLHRCTLAPKAAFGPAIKFTNHTIPLYGSRAWVAADGQVALLAGSDTVWLLRAHRGLLARPPEGEF